MANPSVSEKTPIHKQVIDRLCSQGDVYRTSDGRLYYHMSLSKGGAWDEVLALDIGNQRLRSLVTSLGVNAATASYNRVVEGLKTKADLAGRRVDVHRVSANQGDAIFVDQGWQDTKPVAKMWRVTSGRIEEVPNGTDGVLFLADPRNGQLDVRGIECTDLCSDHPVLRLPRLLRLLSTPVFGGGTLTKEQADFALLVGIYNLYFDAPTNPILVSFGERNSSKTWLGKAIQHLYTGSNVVMGADGDYKDISAALTNRRLAVIDNFDEAKPKLLDLLARAATGGEESRRELYTTNKEVAFPFTAKVLVTQRNATLARDDVVERLVILRCQEQTNLIPEAELRRRLERAAPVVRGAILHDLRHLLAEFEVGPKGWTSKFRMADYAMLGHYVARIEEKTPEWDATLKALMREQLEYLGSASPLIAVLEEFLQQEAGRFQGTAGALHVALEGYPGMRNIKTSEQLGSELRRARASLELRGITLTWQEDRARKQMVYQLDPEVALMDAPTAVRWFG